MNASPTNIFYKKSCCSNLELPAFFLYIEKTSKAGTAAAALDWESSKTKLEGEEEGESNFTNKKLTKGGFSL